MKLVQELENKNYPYQNVSILWNLTHLPAELIREASQDDKRVIIEGIFDAIKQIVQSLSSEAYHCFDFYWPLLECLEELAGQVAHYSDLRKVFAKEYLSTYDQANSYFKAQLVWGVNELLERGRNAAELGLFLAVSLCKKDTLAEKIIFRLKRKLKGCAEHIEKYKNFVSRIPPYVDDSYLIHPEEEMPKIVSQLANNIQGQRELQPISELLPGRIEGLIDCWDIAAGCEKNILAMIEMKTFLGQLCTTVKGVNRPRTENLFFQQKESKFIQDLCTYILGQVNGNPSKAVFSSIEALEAVRDKYPRDCSTAMGTLITRGAALPVLQAVMLCDIEGLEETTLGKTPQLSKMRLERFDHGWEVVGQVSPEQYPEEQELSPCFHSLAHSINQQPSNSFLIHLAQWANWRMNLHPADTAKRGDILPRWKALDVLNAWRLALFSFKSESSEGVNQQALFRGELEITRNGHIGVLVKKGHQKEPSLPLVKTQETSQQSVRTQSLSDILEWMEKNASLENLRKIDVAAKRLKKSLLENIPPEQIKPMESYYLRMIDKKPYWYKTYTKNGKRVSKYVGTELPSDLDLTTVSVSDKKRAK